MASMRDIKRRRNSVASTQQITKAMKLVSTAKLKKAKVCVEEGRPYFEKMQEKLQRLYLVRYLKHPPPYLEFLIIIH